VNRKHLTATVSALLGTAAALLGSAVGTAVYAAQTGASMILPLLGLATTLCCAAGADLWADESAAWARTSGQGSVVRHASMARHLADRGARLAVALALHPVLVLAFLPLCRVLPVPPASALSGPDADAARALRRIVRTATEQDAWVAPSATPMTRLLLRHHTRFSARVARATAGSARRAALEGLRGDLPVLYALLLSALGLALVGPGEAGPSGTATTVCVFLTVVTTPLRKGTPLL